MEGFWSIVLRARGRLPVNGVVVFVGDHIFGGDPCFYWTGTYATRGDKIEATLEVISHSGSAVGNIFGDSVTRSSLQFSANAPASQAIDASFTANGPGGLTATLTRRA
jgi:T3SS negative regulator,GrlR